MKITKQQLHRLIQEEIDALEENLDLGRLAGHAVDDTHLLLLETAERYRAIVEANPELADSFVNSTRIVNLHASFKRMAMRVLREPGKKQSMTKV